MIELNSVTKQLRRWAREMALGYNLSAAQGPLLAKAADYIDRKSMFSDLSDAELINLQQFFNELIIFIPDDRIKFVMFRVIYQLEEETCVRGFCERVTDA